MQAGVVSFGGPLELYVESTGGVLRILGPAPTCVDLGLIHRGDTWRVRVNGIIEGSAVIRNAYRVFTEESLGRSSISYQRSISD